MSRYAPIDLGELRLRPLGERASKVSVDGFAQKPRAGGSFREFYDGLPDILAGSDIRAVVSAIARSRREGRPVILAMGAHVVKCGLNPVIIELLRRNVVTAVALNGAGPIHDIELALAGQTSEDVQAGLKDGFFGMAAETGEVIEAALAAVDPEATGLGEAVGAELIRRNPPHLAMSLTAAAVRQDIPVTVHVALGTDIVHMRKNASGARLGAASFTDFRIFTSVVADLDGGVFINAGSSVILPEVFLKALAIARNIGADIRAFTTVNLDMIAHYRPTVNVVQRPRAVGGEGFALNGRHELLLPLLAWAVLEELDAVGGL